MVRCTSHIKVVGLLLVVAAQGQTFLSYPGATVDEAAGKAALAQQIRSASEVYTPTVECSPKLSSNVSIYATGLAGPRGLKFGPDGRLYVAEAGFGGTHSAAGQCDQVPAPVGPS